MADDDDCTYLLGFIPWRETDECRRRRKSDKADRANERREDHEDRIDIRQSEKTERTFERNKDGTGPLEEFGIGAKNVLDDVIGGVDKIGRGAGTGIGQGFIVPAAILGGSAIAIFLISRKR